MGTLQQLSFLLMILSNTLAVQEARAQEVWIVPQVYIMAVVTAYTNSPDEGWGDGQITASGQKVRNGFLACPRQYRFGTAFKIKDKTYFCQDWMNKRYEDKELEHFDILMMNDKQGALEWGRQVLEIEKL